MIEGNTELQTIKQYIVKNIHRIRDIFKNSALMYRLYSEPRWYLGFSDDDFVGWIKYFPLYTRIYMYFLGKAYYLYIDDAYSKIDTLKKIVCEEDNLVSRRVLDKFIVLFNSPHEEFAYLQTNRFSDYLAEKYAKAPQSLARNMRLCPIGRMMLEYDNMSESDDYARDVIKLFNNIIEISGINDLIRCFWIDGLYSFLRECLACGNEHLYSLVTDNIFPPYNPVSFANANSLKNRISDNIRAVVSKSETDGGTDNDFSDFIFKANLTTDTNGIDVFMMMDLFSGNLPKKDDADADLMDYLVLPFNWKEFCK